MEQLLSTDCIELIFRMLPAESQEVLASVSKHWLELSRENDPVFESYHLGMSAYTQAGVVTFTIGGALGVIYCALAGTDGLCEISLEPQLGMTACYGFWCFGHHAHKLSAAFATTNIRPRTLRCAYYKCM